MPVFTVSCLKHTVRGKAFEDEERSKVPPHSNLYRCTKRTTGGASSSVSASGIAYPSTSVLVQKMSVRNEGNFSAYGSKTSVRLVPDQSW